MLRDPVRGWGSPCPRRQLPSPAQAPREAELAHPRRVATLAGRAGPAGLTCHSERAWMPPSAGRKGRGSELPALWRTCPPPPRSLGPRAGGTGRRSELSPRQNRPSCPQPRCPRLPVTPGTDSLSLHTSGPSARPGPGLALSSLWPSLPAEVPARHQHSPPVPASPESLTGHRPSLSCARRRASGSFAAGP